MLIKKIFVISFIALFSFQSCSVFKPVSLVPAYNAAIIHDATELGKQVDLMFLTMEQSIDKNYDTYAADYNAAEILINSIITRNAVRPKSEPIVRQANIYKEALMNAREYHKKKKELNPAEIRTYRNYLRDELKPLLVSELNLK